MPGLSSDPSGKGAGLCGRHAATKIMRRITRAPKAIPSIAALEIVAASNKKMVLSEDDFMFRRKYLPLKGTNTFKFLSHINWSVVRMKTAEQVLPSQVISYTQYLGTKCYSQHGKTLVQGYCYCWYWTPIKSQSNSRTLPRSIVLVNIGWLLLIHEIKETSLTHRIFPWCCDKLYIWIPRSAGWESWHGELSQ